MIARSEVRQRTGRIEECCEAVAHVLRIAAQIIAGQALLPTPPYPVRLRYRNGNPGQDVQLSA